MPKPGGFLENKCGKPKPIGVFLHGLIDHELPSTTCMKEQSCPGHGLWEQCDHGPSGGMGGGGESCSSTEQANGTSGSAP